MNIVIQTEKLKSVIQQIGRVAGRHATLQVLSCILIEFTKTSAVFKATNLDVGIEISVPVKSDEKGVVAIPAQVLNSFISQIPEAGGVVSLGLDGMNVKISTSHSKGLIKAMPSDDFPIIPKISGGHSFEINSEVLLKGIRSVAYSASVSSVKPELSSVYVYQDGENLVFVATDSFRLAEKRVKIQKSVTFNEILIPFKNTADIIRFLEENNGQIKVTTSKNLIALESNGIYLVSRIIDGVFPDYKQIIPKGYMTEVVVLKQDIINALKISNVFSDKFNQVKLIIDPKGKVFNIQTKNSDVGESVTSVQAALSGEKIEVNFNYKYISDCFQSIDADSVSLQLSGLNRPMVIRPVSGEQNFLYIAMPMNR